MDQTAAKRILQELIKRADLDNKICADCSNPNPQWASVSFAIFICLQCAGYHRGYGVHISFVRSVSMDTWSEEQIKRMQAGGNQPFKDFIKSYTPAEQGGYREGMNPHETYHSWAAAQYKSKLDADLAGQSWSPSAPPPDAIAPPGRPTSAQGLRKSRASARAGTGSSLRSNSGSPASFARQQSESPIPPDQKSANEVYFERLGNTNASRPEHVPPSQGGRYTGFGSTPTPPPGSSSPSFGLSSRAAPSLSDFQDNPVAALSKGWSLLSSVVASTARTVSENVIQPGMERVLDPEFQANVRGYAAEAANKATQVGASANEWSKHQFGVDVAGQVSGAVGSVVGGRSHEGYGALSQQHDGESSGLYQGNDVDGDDDFFDQMSGAPARTQSTTGTVGGAPTGGSGGGKKTEDWDEWKDF